jgi:hypothetical protein
VLPGQCAESGDDHQQVHICCTGSREGCGDHQPLLVVGMAVQRHKQTPACKGWRRPGPVGLDEKHRRHTQGNNLLRNAAQQPGTQATLSMRTHHDQIRPQFVCVLFDAAGDIFHLSGMDVLLHVHARREGPGCHLIQIGACLGRIRKVPVAVYRLRRTAFDDVE